MSKMGNIRSCVQNNPGAKLAQIVSITGLSSAVVSTYCSHAVRDGEFVRDTDGGYTRNADFVVGKRGARKYAGKPKKVRGNREHLRAQRKGKQKPRTMADVARRHLAAEADPAQVIAPKGWQLATHIKTALNAFAATIDMSSLEPMSQLAWQSLTEAVALTDSAACPF